MIVMLKKRTMPKKKSVPKSLGLKKQLQTTDRELSRLHQIQWLYSKRMLKFGMASWIFGLATFFFAVILMDAQLLTATFNVWVPLLIIALAVPVMITVVMIRKFARKIRYLERLRHGLLTEYERALLKKVEKMITEK